MYKTIYDKYELRQITHMGKNKAKPLARKPGLLHIFFITFLLLPLEPKRWALSMLAHFSFSSGIET